jgi:hypothetical protein
MRISHSPIVKTEMILGAEGLSGMLERAMKACATRSLPDVRLDFMHIEEFRNMAVRRNLGAEPHANFKTQGYVARIKQPNAGRPKAVMQM